MLDIAYRRQIYKAQARSVNLSYDCIGYIIMQRRQSGSQESSAQAVNRSDLPI